MKNIARHWLWLAIGCLLLSAAPALAQNDPTCAQPVTDDDVNRVSKGLYCPVCENVPLEVCPTEACARWREQVRDLLACGASEQEVRDYFVARFGQVAVGTPTDPTLQFFTMTLPLLLIGALGVLIALTLWRWRAKSAEPTVASELPETDDPYRAAVERELDERF
jgi:cytochrome c-type biogenesis protein CcmH